jgi:hypothetical protein
MTLILTTEDNRTKNRCPTNTSCKTDSKRPWSPHCPTRDLRSGKSEATILREDEAALDEDDPLLEPVNAA